LTEFVFENFRSSFFSYLQSRKQLAPRPLEEFKTELHELVPSLKDLTDEELERLTDRNTDDFDE
jgi:hypothetical protein